MKLYNSLTRKVEEFKPIKSTHVGLYTCGPTVYDYPTIGNWRTYVLSDTLVRTLRYLKYDVDYIMNITDVGHLTGDNLGDADTGEDRMEAAAKRERKTAWEIADFYTKDFLADFAKLNLLPPRKFVKAAEHIQEQIELVKRIEERGLAYKISDGIYFDTGKYGRYGELSTLDEIKEGARVEPNPEKKDPRDFALWKFSPKDRQRDMEWDSPWGKGFPGWHIECSAMSIKYLGEQFDVHVGGEDLRSTHHPNEIVQAEAATGKRPFVKHWVHGAFLLVDGGRMGKSLGNAYTLHDVVKKGFAPLDLRYFYLTAHYRKQQNFTWEGLGGARKARERLNNVVMPFMASQIGGAINRTTTNRYRKKFIAAISSDLSVPEGVAVVWEVVKSDLEEREKYSLLLEFDKVLGLKLDEGRRTKDGEKRIPDDVRDLVEKREELREKEKWEEADKIRKRIEDRGYSIEDTSEGAKINLL